MTTSTATTGIQIRAAPIRTSNRSAAKQADDQQEERKAERPDAADIDAMRAALCVNPKPAAVRRPAIAAAAVRRDDLRLARGRSGSFDFP